MFAFCYNFFLAILNYMYGFITKTKTSTSTTRSYPTTGQFESIEEYDSVNEAYSSSNDRLAFPGAEGYGSLASGGRGGTLYLVTSLEDSSTTIGCLRHAVENGPRPLTILFRVTGNIQLTDILHINQGQITIDGVDAPDRGVCIGGNVIVRCTNFIIRHLRFRVPSELRLSETSEDALSIRGPSENGIVDRCSTSWGPDEVLTVNGDGSKTNTSEVCHVHNITVQRCIIAEAFGDQTGEHRFASIFTGANADHISVLRSLFVHCDSRMPRTGHYMENENVDPCFLDFGSNVLYNWGKRSGYNGENYNVPSKLNFVGNWYKTGLSTTDTNFIFHEIGSLESRGHFSNNVLNGVVPTDPYSLVDFGEAWSAEDIADYKTTQEFTTLNTTRIPMTEMPNAVLDDVGCIYPERDLVDLRLISDVKNNTGTIVTEWTSSNYNLPRLEKKRKAAFCYSHDGSAYRHDVDGLKAILRTQGYIDNDFQVYPEATFNNYLDAIDYLVESDLIPGDILFLYMGAIDGGEVTDSDSSENDGEDEYILTCDTEQLQLNSDKIRKKLCKRVPPGVFLTAIISGPHTGTIADLEHNYWYDTNENNEVQLYYRDDNYANVDGVICVFTACGDNETVTSHDYDNVRYTTLGGAFITCAPSILSAGGSFQDILRSIWDKYQSESIFVTPQLACQPRYRLEDRAVF